MADADKRGFSQLRQFFPAWSA